MNGSTSRLSGVWRALFVLLMGVSVTWGGRVQAQSGDAQEHAQAFAPLPGPPALDRSAVVQPLLRSDGRARVGPGGLRSPSRAEPFMGPDGPSARERWDNFRGEIVSPLFLLRTFGPTTGDHLNDTPEPWRGDVVGYGARLASNTGSALLQLTAMHGVAAAGRLDIRFVPRKQGSVASRTGHAVWSTLTARTHDGVLLPDAPRALSSYGATLAQTRWEEARWALGKAAVGVALSFGIEMIVNIVTEFVAQPPPRRAQAAGSSQSRF